LVFLVGMDIVIEEIAGDAHAGSTQFLYRIDGARSAAYVE
jgi:hypothetical protein